MGSGRMMVGVTPTISVPQARTLAAGNLTIRPTRTLPATTTEALFRVTGNVLVKAIIGEVTVIVQTQACNMSLEINPTASGSSVAMCGVLNISAKALGSFFSMTGTFANAMVNGLAVPIQTLPTIVPAGTIDLVTSATNTGSVLWHCLWVPLATDAMVYAA